MWSWERRETGGSIDKAKGFYNVDQDAGEDLETMATETGFATADLSKHFLSVICPAGRLHHNF